MKSKTIKKTKTTTIKKTVKKRRNGNTHQPVLLADSNLRTTTTDGQVIIPHKHDVILGRGGLANTHAGNIRFRRLVDISKPMCVSASREQKHETALSIRMSLQALNPPGRFLKRDNRQRCWTVVSDEKAITKKIKQNLREGVPQRRKKPATQTTKSVAHPARVVRSMSGNDICTEQSTQASPQLHPIAPPSRPSLEFQLTWQDCHYAVFQQQTSLTAKLRDEIDRLGSATSKILRGSTPPTPNKLERDARSVQADAMTSVVATKNKQDAAPVVTDTESAPALTKGFPFDDGVYLTLSLSPTGTTKRTKFEQAVEELLKKERCNKTRKTGASPVPRMDHHGVHKCIRETSNTNDSDTDEGAETVSYVDSHGTLSDTTWPDTNTLDFDLESLAADPALRKSSAQPNGEVCPSEMIVSIPRSA